MPRRPKLQRDRGEILQVSCTGTTSFEYELLVRPRRGEPLRLSFRSSDYHQPLQAGDRIAFAYAAGEAPIRVMFLRNLRNRQILVDHLNYQSRMLSLWVVVGILLFCGLMLFALDWFLVSNTAPQS